MRGMFALLELDLALATPPEPSLAIRGL